MNKKTSVKQSPISLFCSSYYLIKEYKIHEYIPPLIDNMQVYTELFFGGGTMFFNIETQSAIINDINDDIFNFFYLRDIHTKQIDENTFTNNLVLRA